MLSYLAPCEKLHAKTVENSASETFIEHLANFSPNDIQIISPVLRQRHASKLVDNNTIRCKKNSFQRLLFLGQLDPVIQFLISQLDGLVGNAHMDSWASLTAVAENVASVGNILVDSFGQGGDQLSRIQNLDRLGNPIQSSTILDENHGVNQFFHSVVSLAVEADTSFGWHNVTFLVDKVLANVGQDSAVETRPGEVEVPTKMQKRSRLRSLKGEKAMRQNFQKG